jgi:hypothetical protein
MSGKETLLTRLEVSQSGELVAGFRNLDWLSFPNWRNTFCAKAGRAWDDSASEDLKILESNMKNSSSFEISDSAKSSSRSRVVSKSWLVYQLDLPISSKSALPKEFVRGNYTKQARFELKSPWHYVSLPPKLKESLLVKREISKELSIIRTGLAESYGPSAVSRKFNVLANAMRAYQGSNEREILQNIESQKAGNIPNGAFDSMIELQKKILMTNSILDGEGKLSYEFKGNQARGIRLKANDWSFLKEGRMITLEELFKGPLWFFDIEIPSFRGKNPLISWVGSGVIKGKNVDYSIDTIHDLGVESVGDFIIRSHGNEGNQINSIRRRVHQINPIAISAHNAKFDLSKMRESEAGFPIGEDESQPLYKVTSPFFERLEVRDRLVLDTMRWQKKARAYDINAKLEMMVGMKKSISYDEMEELEEGNRRDKLKIANYLTQDIRAPVEGVLLSEPFRKNIEDLLHIAEWSNVSPERLLHSPRCVNEAQERVYFEEIGIYREEIPPNQKTKVMQKKRERARGLFKKLVTEKGIKFKEQSGLFHDVHKVYIPIGNILRDIISHRFPQAREFYDYRDQHLEDKQRLFFIEQYSTALAEWFTESYGEYLGEAKKFKDLMSDLPREEFQKAYDAVKHCAGEDGPNDRKALLGGRLGIKGLERCLDCYVPPFLAKEGIQKEKFLELINSFSKRERVERRLIGNFDVFPSVAPKQTFDQSKSPIVINEVLRREFRKINDFVSDNGFSIVAREGNYLYLTGKDAPNLLFSEECPLVAVDKISKLFVSDNPRYEKHGYYSHLRLSSDPSYHLSVFEMKTLGPMLENLLNGDYRKAREIYRKARDVLERGEISPVNMIFKNKSKERYSIYSTCKEKRIYFIESESLVPKESEIMEESGRKYYIPKDEDKRVYIMSINQSEDYIDRKTYFKRFVQRGRKMLGPALNGKKKEMFEGAQDVFNFN